MKIPILTLDTPNLNGRIYPRETIQKSLEDYITEQVSQKRALIVNNRPENSTVNLQDAIGVIKEITIEDDKVMVEAEFFSDLYQQLLENGKIHLRTSGMATLKKDANGNTVVQEDYKLISCFVTNEPA